MTATSSARPARLADVARAAGVHPATASRALCEATRHQVAPATVARIERAARELGYIPDRAAITLRTRRSRTAGLIAADLADPELAPVLSSAEEQLRAAGYMLLAASAGPDGGLAALAGMRARHTDGIIIASPLTAVTLAAARACITTVTIPATRPPGRGAGAFAARTLLTLLDSPAG